MAGTLSVCLPISVSTVNPRTDLSGFIPYRSPVRPGHGRLRQTLHNAYYRSSSRRKSTVVTLRQTHGFLWRFAAKSPQFSRPFSVICAGKSPEDFSKQDGKDEEGQFVAPRVTPDYVAKESIKPPARVVKNLEGPWITRWGGNVRGGKYRMGQGTDRIIDIFANGDAMLVAAGGLIVLFFLLLQFGPDAPPPPPAS